MRCQKVRLISSRSCNNIPQSHGLRPLSRRLSSATALKEEQNEQNDKQNDGKNYEGESAQPSNKAEGEGSAEKGAMSRRLEQMTEESLQAGSKSDRENIQKAGFSEELKAKLEDKIAAASFKSDHAAAFSIANMPVRHGTQNLFYISLYLFFLFHSNARTRFFLTPDSSLSSLRSSTGQRRKTDTGYSGCKSLDGHRNHT